MLGGRELPEIKREASAGFEKPHIGLHRSDVRDVRERDSLRPASVDEIDDRAMCEIAVGDLHADSVAVPYARQLLPRTCEPVVTGLQSMGVGAGRDIGGRIGCLLYTTDAGDQ